MPCMWGKLPDGTVFHARVAKQRVTWCKFCLANGGRKVASTKLCDFPIGNGKTCDAPICDRHATGAGPDIDHCPVHSQQSTLFSQTEPKEPQCS